MYSEAVDTIRLDILILNRCVYVDDYRGIIHYARLTEEVEDRIPVDVLTQQSRYWHREHCADLRTCQ